MRQGGAVFPGACLWVRVRVDVRVPVSLDACECAQLSQCDLRVSPLP